MLLTSISLSELRASLQAALATGKAGEIVNVRLHWQLPVSEVSIDDHKGLLLQALLNAVDLCDVALQLGPVTWRIRLSSNARLVHAMGVDDRGRTLIVSVADDADPLVQLTVFGNHGVIRLDHAELATDFEQRRSTPIWADALVASFNAAFEQTKSELR